jgi:hypothetical protein
MANDKAPQDTLRANGTKPSGAKTSPYSAGDDNRTTGDWSVIQANAEDVRLLVASVLAAGDAVMFSCARKGTAYAVTIYHDGIPTKKWAAELDVFEEIVDFFTKIALQQIPQEVAKRFTT